AVVGAGREPVDPAEPGSTVSAGVARHAGAVHGHFSQQRLAHRRGDDRRRFADRIPDRSSRTWTRADPPAIKGQLLLRVGRIYPTSADADRLRRAVGADSTHVVARDTGGSAHFRPGTGGLYRTHSRGDGPDPENTDPQTGDCRAWSGAL